ncbi:MAG: autotransporter outer membrane beta-barrel domain-containing protein [Luteibacter sp.]
MRISRGGLALGSSLVLLGTSATSESLGARTVGIGESVVVAGSGSRSDIWELSKDSVLVLREGAKSGYIRTNESQLHVSDSVVASSQGTAISAVLRSVITLDKSFVHDESGVGVGLFGGLDPKRNNGSSMIMTDSRSSGLLAGAVVGGSSSMELRASTLSATGDNGIGLLLASGRVDLGDRSTIEGIRAGVVFGSEWGVPSGPASLTVATGSSVKSVSGPAVLVSGTRNSEARATLAIRDGGRLIGGNGVAVDMRDGAALNLSIERSAIAGSLLVSQDSSARVRLLNGGHLEGEVHGPARIDIERGGVWTVPSSSRIDSLTLTGGTARFVHGQSEPHSLRIAGNMDGSAGDLVLNVHMDGKNASKSWADSVLIEGDADVLRPVDVALNLSGAGQATDLNGDGKQSASEGFSLIQVAGSSRPDAFRLKGDFVTLGAFQYQLKAFSGDEIDQAASRLESGPAKWDYRLAERIVCEKPCSGEAGNGAERPAVAPQIASYISAPGAVFAYADSISTGLHERLGEIRDHAFEGSVGGELFARYSGNDQRYSSNRSFKEYGYDFDERVEAWQFGGSIVGLDGDNGSLRAGWALDHGTSSVVPRAVDGDSVTRLKANGTSAWVTWRSGTGFWVDWVVGRQRMRGRTDTAHVGGVGRVRATSTGMSLGLGMPWDVGQGWRVEPHVLIASQNVAIDKITEASGLNIQFAGRQYVTTTAGVSVVRDVGTFAPFVRLDLRSTSGDGRVDAGTDSGRTSSRFATGRAGDEYLVSGGMTAQLTDRLQVFGESAYRHYLNRGGFQGWSGTVGARLTF